MPKFYSPNIFSLGPFVSHLEIGILDGKVPAASLNLTPAVTDCVTSFLLKTWSSCIWQVIRSGRETFFVGDGTRLLSSLRGATERDLKATE